MKMPLKNTANNLMKTYCDAYNQRDMKKILSLFTKNCTLWGTAQDEIRVGLQAMAEQHERDWSQSEKGEIHVVSTVPTPENANWSASINKALITIEGETHQINDLRGTIIIEEEDGQWKIAFMHASFPDQRNVEGDSFPVS